MRPPATCRHTWVRRILPRPGFVARLPTARQRFAPQARLVVETVPQRLIRIFVVLGPIDELVGEYVAVGLVRRRRQRRAGIDRRLLRHDLLPARRRGDLGFIDRAVAVGRDVASHRHGDQRGTASRVRVLNHAAHRRTRGRVGLVVRHAEVAVVIPIGTGVGGVVLPVVAGRAIAAAAVERAIGDVRRVRTVDPGRNRLHVLPGVDR